MRKLFMSVVAIFVALGALTACDPADNKELFRIMVAAEWPEDAQRQFECGDYIIMHESAYQDDVVAPGTGDQGIPQAHPTKKNPYPMGKDWKHKPWVQIKWMISYVKNRPGYGNMCKALVHKKAKGWY